jgi:hypothetical protein
LVRLSGRTPEVLRVGSIGRALAEIEILQRHLTDVDFDPEVKSRWAAHLTYCYLLLVATAPSQFVPHFTVG